MHPSPSSLAGIALLALVFVPLPASAQSDPLPSCISACFDKSPFSSFCDGDEQGDALDRCTCQSYLNGGTLAIECMKTDCSRDDQGVLAARLPDLCRDDLLPDAAAAPENDSNADETAAPGATPTSDDANDNDDDNGTPVADDDATPSAAEPSAGADNDDSSALGRGLPGLLGAAGLVAAFFL